MPVAGAGVEFGDGVGEVAGRDPDERAAEDRGLGSTGGVEAGAPRVLPAGEAGTGGVDREPRTDADPAAGRGEGLGAGAEGAFAAAAAGRGRLAGDGVWLTTEERLPFWALPPVAPLDCGMDEENPGKCPRWNGKAPTSCGTGWAARPPQAFPKEFS